MLWCSVVVFAFFESRRIRGESRRHFTFISHSFHSHGFCVSLLNFIFFCYAGSQRSRGQQTDASLSTMVQAQLTREQICHGISDNVKHFKKIYKGSFLALDITLATDTEKKRIIIKVTEFELYKREYSLVRRGRILSMGSWFMVHVCSLLWIFWRLFCIRT